MNFSQKMQQIQQQFREAAEEQAKAVHALVEAIKRAPLTEDIKTKLNTCTEKLK